MSAILGSAFVTIAAIATACSPSEVTERVVKDRVVAESGTSTLTYNKMRCHPRLRDTAPECHRVEQATLRRWIYEQAFECAALARDISLTPEELQAIDAKATAERTAMEPIARRHRVLLRGVLRVQEGAATIDQVAVDLAKEGIQAVELEERLDYYADASETRRALEIDHVAAMKAASRRGRRTALLFQKLKKHADDRARTSGRAVEEEERALWTDAVKRCRMRVVDDYEMPDFKGVFDIHEQQIPLH